MEDAAPDGPTARPNLGFVAGVGALLALAVVGGLFAGRWLGQDDDERAAAEAAEQAAFADRLDVALADATPGPADSAMVFGQVAPSFVAVEVTRADDSELSAATRSSSGLGAGVVVNADGDIITARHVVANADAITVTYADGTRSSATVISSQPERDMAVLRSDKGPAALVPAVLGSVATMNVGDPVFAIGNPLGLPASISSGVISGFNRSIDVDEDEGEDGRLTGLIQFDAAVNPGSSGGPLVNRRGHVIGIVTALAAPADDDFFRGIGFAMPIAFAAGGSGGPEQ